MSKDVTFCITADGERGEPSEADVLRSKSIRRLLSVTRTVPGPAPSRQSFGYDLPVDSTECGLFDAGLGQTLGEETKFVTPGAASHRTTYTKFLTDPIRGKRTR